MPPVLRLAANARSRPYATARICTHTRTYTHTYVHTHTHLCVRARTIARLRFAYRRFGSRDEPTAERRGNHGGQNGIDYALPRVVPWRSSAGTRGGAYVISSSRSRARTSARAYTRLCVREGCTHTRVKSSEARDSLAYPLFRRNLTTGSLTRPPSRRPTPRTLLRHFGRTPAPRRRSSSSAVASATVSIFCRGRRAERAKKKNKDI